MLPECCEHEGRRILIRQENKGGTSIHQKSGRSVRRGGELCPQDREREPGEGGGEGS